jgi:hypothetical protein
VDETTNEQGITPVEVVDDEMTPTGESVPRRFAVQSIVGGFAGLAALAAAGAGAQEKKKKSIKKKSSKQKVSAQAAKSGQLTRVRRVTAGPIRFPATGSERYNIMRLRCPRAKNSEEVYVLNGGYALSSATAPTGFTVSFNAAETNSTWRVDGHNESGQVVNLFGNAVCAYFRK